MPTNGYASGWSARRWRLRTSRADRAALAGQASLKGNVDATETLLEKKALHLKTTETCGGTQGKVPNNVFGYGVLNIYRAVIAP